MLIWSGFVGAAGWMAVYAWLVRDMPNALNWSDIPANPTRRELQQL